MDYGLFIDEDNYLSDDHYFLCFRFHYRLAFLYPLDRKEALNASLSSLSLPDGDLYDIPKERFLTLCEEIGDIARSSAARIFRSRKCNLGDSEDDAERLSYERGSDLINLLHDALHYLDDIRESDESLKIISLSPTYKEKAEEEELSEYASLQIEENPYPMHCLFYFYKDLANLCLMESNEEIPLEKRYFKDGFLKAFGPFIHDEYAPYRDAAKQIANTVFADE